MTDDRGLRPRRFHQQLDEIDAAVGRLFALVTEGIAAATDALLANDAQRARELKSRDALLDQLEEDLEQLAERELATQQPMAGDLRYLLSVLRVVPELERSGDLAEHVASRASTGLAERLTPAVRGVIEQMGAICVDMWQAADDAWVERDPAAAATIDARDDEMDALAERLTDLVLGGELALAEAVQTTLLGRFYERLGDHAVHIAERVRYLTPNPRAPRPTGT